MTDIMDFGLRIDDFGFEDFGFEDFGLRIDDFGFEDFGFEDFGLRIDDFEFLVTPSGGAAVDGVEGSG